MSEATAVTSWTPKRPVLLYAVVFCLAYGMFVAYQFGTDARNNNGQMPTVSSGVQAGVSKKLAASMQNPSLLPAANTRQQMMVSAATSVSTSSSDSTNLSAVTERKPEEAPTPEVQQEIQQNILQATQAADAAERTKAVNYLREAPHTTEVFHAMATVASGDESAINRLSAVTAMSQWSTDPDKRVALLAMMQQVMSDPNPRVSAKAKAAYAQLAALNE
jgi:hypothetical protein